MKLLILGGTFFLGRHVVEAALDAGHDVAIFTRGQTNPGLYPNVRHIVGDRNDESSLPSGETWDAVVDIWAKVPAMVRASATALQNRAGTYVFVSSLSVFGPGTPPGFNETAPTLAPAGRDDPWDPERYGELKVACEREAEEAMGGRALIVRPGLIVGPYDPTDRFTYWPVRIARGGDVLAPGRPARSVQIIHARDLADWMVGMMERGEFGVFNATGPALPFGDLLDACASASDTRPNIVWVAEERLLAAGVEPWSEIPVWLPEESEFAFLLQADISKAANAGLTSAPPARIARETLAWHRSRPEPGLAAGLDPAREAALLDALAHP